MHRLMQGPRIQLNTAEYGCPLEDCAAVDCPLRDCLLRGAFATGHR